MCVCAHLCNHVQLLVTPWTVACQSPLSMESSRQEYWSGLLFPTLGDLPNSGVKPESPVSPALADGFLERRSRSVMSDSLRPHGLYSPWNSPGQNTGVGSLSLFQGIFPTQGLNPGLLHCRRILYQLNHKGNPTNSLPLCWPGKPQKMNITLYFDKFFDLKEENYFKNDTIIIMTLNFLKAKPDETIYSLRAMKNVLDFIY